MSSVAAEALSFSSSLQDKKKGLLHEYHKVKGDTEEVEREKDFSDKLSDFFGLNTTQVGSWAGLHELLSQLILL